MTHGCALPCTSYAILTKSQSSDKEMRACKIMGAWRCWRKHHLWACLCVCLLMWCIPGGSGLCHSGLLQHHGGGCRGREGSVGLHWSPHSWKWSWGLLQGHVWHRNNWYPHVHLLVCTVAQRNSQFDPKNFKALKSGLSAYSHDLGRAIRDDVKQETPFVFWKVTSLVFMGRANLNLLLGEKAQKQLQETQGERSIDASPSLWKMAMFLSWME